MTSQFNVGDIVKLITKSTQYGSLKQYDTRMVRWVKDNGSEIAVRVSAKNSDTVDVVRLPSRCFKLVRRGSPPERPFEVGDVVRCHTRSYAGIRYGQDVRVKSMKMGTIGEWLAQFDTTGGKDYYARNFHKAPKELQPEKRDTMFVAIKMYQDSLPATARAIEGGIIEENVKSMDDKEALKRWVADRVASTGEPWVLLYAAQICRPTAQVDWTNAG